MSVNRQNIFYKMVPCSSCYIFFDFRIESDIRMAKNCNLRSILVLTGSTKRTMIPYNDPDRRPDFISESISELLTYMVSAALRFLSIFYQTIIKCISFSGKGLV